MGRETFHSSKLLWQCRCRDFRCFMFQGKLMRSVACQENTITAEFPEMWTFRRSVRVIRRRRSPHWWFLGCKLSTLLLFWEGPKNHPPVCFTVRLAAYRGFATFPIAILSRSSGLLATRRANWCSTYLGVPHGMIGNVENWCFGVQTWKFTRHTSAYSRFTTPHHWMQELIAELADLGFAGTFNFLYIPLDKGTMSNVGYAFVNFVTKELASKCIETFQGYRFKRHRKTSGKVAATFCKIGKVEDALSFWERDI